MEYKWITDNEYHYCSGYYTTNKWIGNDKVVIMRSKDAVKGMNSESEGYASELVLVSLDDGTKKVLANDIYMFEDFVVYEDKVYYSNIYELKEIDVNTGKIRVVYRNEYYVGEKSFEKGIGGELSRIQSPHITNDGKYISMFISGHQKPTAFIRINLETGEAEKVFEKGFIWHPLDEAKHVMICPTDKDLFFFCHEGNTFYISNRLWLADYRTKKMWNIAKQKLDDDGNLGDCYGHEMWAPDGKGLYFVKYSVSPVPPRGICYVDAQTGKAELLYSKYKYWHVGVSADGRYLTSDTFLISDDNPGAKYSEVVIVDMETNEEILIDKAGTTWSHPAHPHPQLSPDNSKLMYTSVTEDGRVAVKIAYLK